MPASCFCGSGSELVAGFGAFCPGTVELAAYPALQQDHFLIPVAGVDGVGAGFGHQHFILLFILFGNFHPVLFFHTGRGLADAFNGPVKIGEKEFPGTLTEAFRKIVFPDHQLHG